MEDGLRLSLSTLKLGGLSLLYSTHHIVSADGEGWGTPLETETFPSDQTAGAHMRKGERKFLWTLMGVGALQRCLRAWAGFLEVAVCPLPTSEKKSSAT